MHFREIKIVPELEEYRQTISKEINVLLPLEYLRQGRVFCFFNHADKICGGFTIITEGPFRVLESIPIALKFKSESTLLKTAEITGVWLSATDRKKITSLQFWLHLIYQIIKSKKKYFVFAYSLKKIGLQRLYARTNPIVLFRGETKILPGMPSPDFESVEVVLRSRIFIQILKNLDFFMKKLFFFFIRINRNKSHPFSVFEDPFTSSYLETE